MFNIKNLNSLHEELKCTQCKKVLSVLPVYYCAVTGNVCGRCSHTLDWMISNGTLERAVAYEAVAKYILFPCCNKDMGCTKALKCDEVLAHETVCILREVKCPFNLHIGKTDICCEWRGNMTDLEPHLRDNHAKDLYTSLPNFVIDNTETNSNIALLSFSEKIFIILTKYIKEHNKFYCTVMCISEKPENQFYRYQIEVGKYNEYFLILRKNYLEPYSNIDEIIDDHDKMITIDVNSVLTMLGNLSTEISFKVGVAKKNKKETAVLMEELNLIPKAVIGNLEKKEESQNAENKLNSKIEQKVDKNTNQNLEQLNPPKLANVVSKAKTKKLKQAISPTKPGPSKGEMNSVTNMVPAKGKSIEKLQSTKEVTKLDIELLEELECPVCSHYMIPPIFICPTGHSICSECKNRVQQCPSCRHLIQGIRNYTLEKLTTKVRYPCRFTDSGCPEILPPELISFHEANCSFANICPLKHITSCKLKEETIDIVKHIREMHATFLVFPNQEYSRNIEAQVTTSYYATVFNNEVFFVCCKHSSTTGPVKFNIVHYGMKKNQPKYRFEFEFIDQTHDGMKLIVNQLCQEFSNNLSTFVKNCLTIPLDMLKPFIARTPQFTLFFKFRIEPLERLRM